MNRILKAGAAQTAVTPPLGTVINGDFLTHFAKFIHDPLYAKALVLQNDQTTIALVVVDICAMAKDLLDEVKQEITTRTGIPAAQVMISSTHTHASGSVLDVHLVAADLPYRKSLPPRIANAVVQAKNALQPARIAFGAVDAPEHVMCRRYFMKNGYAPRNPVTGGVDQVKTNPFGHEHQIDRSAAMPDPQLSYLAVQAIDGQWISLFANYSLHYIGDWENGTISADYFGEFAARITQKLQADQHFIGILSNGTSGDINLWDFLVPDRFPKGLFQKTAMIAEDLAEKVFQTIGSLQWETAPDLAVAYQELEVSVRKPGQQDLEAAKKIVGNTVYEKLAIYNGSELIDDDLQRHYAREQVLLHEYPDSILFPVQAIRIGSGIIGALAGEFFAETGLWLKEKNQGTSYFTVGLANGFIGYVPPAHEIAKGGYETWRCRSSFLSLHAENQVRDQLVQLIRQLK